MTRCPTPDPLTHDQLRARASARGTRTILRYFGAEIHARENPTRSSQTRTGKPSLTIIGRHA
jgi:hypothetical protein